MDQKNKRVVEMLSSLEILNEKNRFVVTGATGIIGSNIINFLDQVRETYNLEFEIYGLCRNENKLRELTGSSAEFIAYDMVREIELNVDEPIIIHTASPTSTDMFVNEPSKVHEIINASTDHIIKFARKTNAKKLIQLSTMEVYGEQPDNIEIIESDSFGLDLLNTRNCYPIAKMAAENYLMSAHKDYGLPVTILRLTQVMAPPIYYNDNRVVFQFARNIVNEENIIMRTTGQTYRSYVFYLDVITAILFAADKGVNGEVYNVSTPNSCVSIVDLAQRMIQIKNSNIQIEYDLQSNEKTGYRDKLGLCINSNKLEQLGWQAIVSLDESLELLINSLQNLQQ